MPRRKLLIYHDESGTPGVDKAFVSGVLLLHKEKQGQDILDRATYIRNKWHYYNEFHYQKMSNLRAKVYLDLLQECLQKCIFKYCAIVIQKHKLDMSHFRFQPYLAYNFFTKNLIYHNIKNLSGRTYIYSDAKSRIKHDNFLEYLKHQLNLAALFNGHGYNVKAIEPTDSKNNDLIQITDLFTGAVKQIYDPAPSSRKVELKNKIVSSRYWRIRTNIWDWTPRKPLK